MREPTIDDQVRERLRLVAQQWSVQPPLPLQDPPELVDDPAPARGWQAALDGRAFRALVVIISVLVLAGAWSWWQGRPREVVPVVAEGAAVAPSPAAASGGEVVVHVVGSVRRPGLVRLPAGSRVADAIDAAGGGTAPKVLSTVNLARVLVDGEQIAVGARGAAGQAQGGLPLNSAKAADFEALPGIGPVLAQRIVAWREQHGAFRSVDELGEVPGIGDAILGQVRPLVRV